MHSRWGHTGSRGTYVACTGPQVPSRAFGRARNPGCAQGRWGRKIGGAPGIRAGPLRPQDRKGPWNAGREAQTTTWEGSMQCEEGG